MNSKVLLKSGGAETPKSQTRPTGSAGASQNAAAAESSEAPTAPLVGVRLKDLFNIWPGVPLGHLDAPHAAAFAAGDVAAGNDQLFALVCDGSVVPRSDIVGKLKEIHCPDLLQLVDWGPVPWPSGRDPGARRLVVVYERPGGDRVVGDLSATIAPMSEEQVIGAVLTPVVSALRQLSSYGIIHRAIRPTNLFYRDGARASVVLGDCVTTPPGYAQPALFETIEAAMACPAGRGSGARRNDLFSLGVTILFMLLGRRPGPGPDIDDEALLAARVAHGSYAALVGKAPIPVALREPLRGMLHDEPDQRWDLEDLEKWLVDRRIKSATRHHAEKALRPFAFEGRNFYNCRSLALALTRQWHSNSMTDRKTELVSWIERSLTDGPSPDAIDRAYDQLSGGGGLVGGGAGTALFNARLAIALDPRAPLRYKGFSATIEGIGAALAAGFNDAARTQEFAEIVRGGLAIFWLDLQRFGDRDLTLVAGLFRRLSNYLKDPRPGYGIERCLYELNPGQHCLSNLVDREHVLSINDLLPALDRAANGKVEGTPFDRHLAAFIAARATDDVTGPLSLAAHREKPLEATVGLLSLFATLQWRLGPASLPELTRWVAGSIQPLVATYHHRAARKRIENDLPNLVKAGSLVHLYNFLVNSEMRRHDEAGFATAVQRYAKIDFEIAFLESGGASDPARARGYGRQIAAACSSALGLLALLVFTIAKL
jgi:hypothetical protein